MAAVVGVCAWCPACSLLMQQQNACTKAQLENYLPRYLFCFALNLHIDVMDEFV